MVGYPTSVPPVTIICSPEKPLKKVEIFAASGRFMPSRDVELAWSRPVFARLVRNLSPFAFRAARASL